LRTPQLRAERCRSRRTRVCARQRTRRGALRLLRRRGESRSPTPRRDAVRLTRTAARVGEREDRSPSPRRRARVVRGRRARRGGRSRTVSLHQRRLQIAGSRSVACAESPTARADRTAGDGSAALRVEPAARPTTARSATIPSRPPVVTGRRDHQHRHHEVHHADPTQRLGAGRGALRTPPRPPRRRATTHGANCDDTPVPAYVTRRSVDHRHVDVAEFGEICRRCHFDEADEQAERR